MLKFAVVGIGGLGKAHFWGLKDYRQDEIKLTAVCDLEIFKDNNKSTETNIGSFENPDFSSYNLYDDIEVMFDKEDLDFVVMSLPTHLHEKYAIMALEKGVHVFSEKPMARSLEGCQNMLETAKRNNKLLQIGQCLRFDEFYMELKKYIDTGIYGDLKQLEMIRRSNTPRWSWQNWYMDFEKSGGAALDLHVHDADFINYALGRPDAVFSVANHHIINYVSIATNYIYKNGPIVRAVGDWGMNFKSWKFQADFIAVFEKAVCIATRETFTVYPEDGEKFELSLKENSPGCYINEVGYFVDCILGKCKNEIVPPESAMQTVEIVLAEMKSAELGEKVEL